jgi:predicted helicase
VFNFTYAIFHSPTYRTRYADLLKFDFPRLPIPVNGILFRDLAGLGKMMISLQLLEAGNLDQLYPRYIGRHDPEIEKVSWTRDTVWVDKAQTSGFSGVSESVWNFHIGGYQVCEKWLKDRKGRTLSNEDVVHYQKIVVALSETIRLMKEIDEVIELHGGWPGAFAAKKAAN